MLRALTFTTAAALALTSCRSGPPPAPAEHPATPVASTATSRVTPHFLVTWAPGAASPQEVQAVSDRAEQAYARYVALLGEARIPKQKLTLRLEGDASSGQFPFVSPDTREIMLYRFPGLGGEYEASVAHELVHALRWAIWTNPKFQTDPALFWEEGFAELLASEAGFPSSGFPNYGTSSTITAGSYLADGHDIPLEALIRQHRALNFRCMAQAYAERISFFEWLRKHRGIAPLIALSYGPNPVTVDALENEVGGSLWTIESQWRQETLAAFRAIPQAEQEARVYRTRTPVRYFPVCGPDVLKATAH